MVKKVKEKQKQKQKQKVKVSQNVKVIVGDIKQKRARKQVSKGKPSQLQKPSISLNIINPYQQFLPNQPPPVPPSKSKLSEVNPSNVPPNILRSLGALGNQNTIIRNELRDLKEFSQNQQATYNSLLLSQKEKETPENVSKPSKIDKMLKSKKMIMSSMNWENLIKSEPKKEEKLVKEREIKPDIYQFLSPRLTPEQERQQQKRQQEVSGSILSGWLGQARENIQKRQQEVSGSILSGWLGQARENIAKEKKKKEFEMALGQQAEDLTQRAIMGAFQELEDEDEEDEALMRDLYIGNLPQTISSSQLQKPPKQQYQPSQATFEGLMGEPMELPEPDEGDLMRKEDLLSRMTQLEGRIETEENRMMGQEDINVGPRKIKVKLSKKQIQEAIERGEQNEERKLMKQEERLSREMRREQRRENRENRMMLNEDIGSRQMEETLKQQLLAQKKAEQGGAGAGVEESKEPERGRTYGRPKGSRNRPKEEIEKERLARQERGRGRPEMFFEPVKEPAGDLLSKLKGKSEEDLRKLSVKQLDEYMKVLGLSTREKGSTNPLPKENKVIAILGMLNLQKYKK